MSYQNEILKQTEKIEKMKTAGVDEYNIRKQVCVCVVNVIYFVQNVQPYSVITAQ